MSVSVRTVSVDRLRPGEGLCSAQQYHDRQVRHEDAVLEPLYPPATVARMSPSSRSAYWRRQDAALRRLNFPSPLEAPAFKALDDSVQEAMANQDGDPSIVLLWGPNRSGKTTLAHRWNRTRYLAALPEPAREPGVVVRVGEERGAADRFCPVIEITVPQGCVPSSLDAAVLDWANVPVNPRPREASRQADRFLMLSECQTLFFDDAHVMKGTPVIGADNLNRLKNFSSRLGKQGGVVVLTSNEDLSWFSTRSLTLASRLVPVEIPYLQAETTEDRVLFQRFLNSAEDVLAPWFPQANGHLVAESAAIYRMTAGIMRDLRDLITRAARTAARAGSDSIEPRHLSAQPTSQLARSVLGSRFGMGG